MSMSIVANYTLSSSEKISKIS